MSSNMKSFEMLNKTILKSSLTESRIEIYFDYAKVDLDLILGVYDIFSNIKDSVLYTNSLIGSISDVQKAIHVLQQNMYFISRESRKWNKYFAQNYMKLYDDVVSCQNSIFMIREENKQKILQKDNQVELVNI